VVAHEAAREGWLTNRNRLQILRVRELLSGRNDDVDSLTIAIRHPLHGRHLALILWWPEATQHDDSLTALEQFAQQAAHALGDRTDCLFVPVDRVTGWAWIVLDSADARDPVATIRWILAGCDVPPSVAVGNPATGLNGFRESHRQAQCARAVAVVADAPTSAATAYSDPGLAVAALFTDRLPAARALVQDVLGELSTHSDGDAKLRRTLMTFLDNESSYTTSAKVLNMHPNSVKYRVQRAIERRGRAISDDRLDVELALMMCERFGDAVLRGE
jgi:DNA-binding PucR family transcriptional regulator